MQIIITLLLIIFLGGEAKPCYALDWKALHEKSQEITLKEAVENSKQDPDSVEKLYVLGLFYLNNYQYAEAHSIFQRILDQDPESMEARWGIAEVFRYNHEFEKSIPILEEIVKNHPRFAPALNSLGYIKYIQTSFADSAKLTAKVINMEEEKVDIVTLVRSHGLYAAAKGMLAQHSGPLSKSVNFFAVKRHLNIAKQLLPDSVVVYFGYGSYYFSIPSVLGRDLDKAEAFLRKAIETDPLFADPYVRLAQIYKSRGDGVNFDKYITQALKLDPKNALALDIKNGTCKFICLE